MWLLATSCLWWLAAAQLNAQYSNVDQRWLGHQKTSAMSTQKDSFLDALIANMTIEDLDHTMRFSPGSPIGVMHDWYTLNSSQNNELQQLNLDKSRLKIPIMHTAECLHGVGSFKQSMFPQSLGLSASFDTDLVYRVGRAIAKEARSTGIHTCFSPVLDIGQDPRWGRMQEAWGEDKILTSHMGVAYSSGLSKNSSWSEPDAVVPVMKHFAAHGSPQSGRNAAPFMGHGNRQVLQDLLTPFKAAVQLGGARGVMMAYNEFDNIPASVHPMLYKALDDWGYEGFVMADDTGMIELDTMHKVADGPADTIAQWFNTGGMLQFYDYSLETYLSTTKGLIANGTVALKTLQSRVRRMLGVKWDLGLFQNPLIPENSPDPLTLVEEHRGLTLEAAQKSIVLLENRNDTLPLRPHEQNISRIALIGPFTDTMNYGDYSGAWGQYPSGAAKTLREGLLAYTNSSKIDLVSSWGANTWEYNGQRAAGKVLPEPQFPGADRGEGLPSNNFSALWEGELESPVDLGVDGWIGVAVGPNTTAKLYVNDQLVMSHGAADQLLDSSTVMGNIMQYTFTQANSTLPPAWISALHVPQGGDKIENVSSLNSQMVLFWNLVDRNEKRAVSQAVQLATSADLVVLADALARAIYATGKPVVLVLQGGRPFAIPEYYASSAAVLSAFFPGQSGGQAIADVLFDTASPGGRMPVTVPRHVGQLPVYYNFKRFARKIKYLDIDSEPLYWFGYGLSYTTFATSDFQGQVLDQPQQLDNATAFSAADTIRFSINVRNSGTRPGSFVAQVYLLSRVSSVVQPVRQLVAFKRVYLDAGEEAIDLAMELDVDRYLTIYNRWDEWELEKGAYTFSLLAHGGSALETGMNLGSRGPSPEYLLNRSDLRNLCLTSQSTAELVRPVLYRTIILHRESKSAEIDQTSYEAEGYYAERIRGEACFGLRNSVLCAVLPLLRTLIHRPHLRSHIKYLACLYSIGGVPGYTLVLDPELIFKGWKARSQEFSDARGFERQVLDMAGLPISPPDLTCERPVTVERDETNAANIPQTDDTEFGQRLLAAVFCLLPEVDRVLLEAYDVRAGNVMHGILERYLTNAATASAVLPKLATLQLQVNELPGQSIEHRSMVAFNTVYALLGLPTLRHIETWRDDGFQSFFHRTERRGPRMGPNINHRDWLPKVETMTLRTANYNCGYFYAACEAATSLRRLELHALEIDWGHYCAKLHSEATLNAALLLRADTLEELRLGAFGRHDRLHLDGASGRLVCLPAMARLRVLRIDVFMLFGTPSEMINGLSLPDLLPPNLERLDLFDGWYSANPRLGRPHFDRSERHLEALVRQFEGLAEAVRPRQHQQPLSRLRSVHLRPGLKCARHEWLQEWQLREIGGLLDQVGVVFTHVMPPPDTEDKS
ncbi:glycoside hydrolase family 3 protein [Apiospora saccharicola]|uniref:xylan 1,4-beta-xylosidase n=1 Tax=Apiospora saccharicola TaxID=335842 RepID=A0ABR1UJL4_9PEZI